MVAPLILVEAQPRHIAYGVAETVRLPGSDPALATTNQALDETSDQNDCLSDHTYQQRINGPTQSGRTREDYPTMNQDQSPQDTYVVESIPSSEGNDAICNLLSNRIMRLATPYEIKFTTFLSLEQLIRLAENFGGRRLYIPMKASDDHELVMAIGRDGFEKLSARAARDVLRIPLFRGLRAQYYRSQGLSNGKIAHKLGVTETGINGLFRKLKREGIDIPAKPSQR